MKRILVVDDEAAIVETLRDILVGEGYEVVVAFNGLEGLNQLREAKPDLVLLDVMMPLLDGLGVLAAMQEHPVHRNVPVVLMSAGRVPQIDSLPVRRFLPKPFELEALLDSVTEALNGVGG
jgi:CheY-like chemotaxis protein